ncbi:MAG: DUF342 domain-containing protein [Candidatus Latescibacteria bacterium]|nr:DUF342 domain-containing protein [Candidatus Latescibacterota bacterium]
MTDTDKLILTLAKNKLKVLADYYPAQDGDSIKEEDILTKLESMGVKVGIKNDVIKNICESKIPQYSIIIAEAIQPGTGEDAYIEHFIDVTETKGIEREDGSIDFKNRGKVPFAKKGQKLYRKVPPTPGKPGIDVLGNEIPGLLGKDIKMPMGKGTALDQVDPNIVRSSTNGELVIQDGFINVLEIHYVRGNVDYETGNIQYKGSVEVSGAVKAGFKVEAEGDIRIMGNVEDAEIIGGNDITIMGGFIGSGSGSIIAGRDVYAKFVANQKIQAKRDIIISGNSHHATLTAGRSIFVNGMKSMIVGGICEAKKTVEAGYFGSNACPHTIIKVGNDPELMDRLKTVREEIDEIQVSKQKIEKNISILTRLKSNDPNQFPQEQQEILNKLEEAQQPIIQKLNELENERELLFKKIKELKLATAVAHLGVFPKVEIHIGNQWLKVEDKLRYSTFKIFEGDVVRFSR